MANFFLDEILDELAVFHLMRVGFEASSDLGDVGEHEVATLGYDRREADVEEKLGETVAFWLELLSDRLEVGLGLFEASQLVLETACDHLLEERRTHVDAVVVHDLTLFD